MVNLFKTEIEVAMEMLDLLKGPFRWPGSSSTPVLVREARDGQRSVKAQVQPSSGSSRPRWPSRRDTSQWETPGVYYADLTLGDRAVKVKLLVRECKRDSRTQARYLYTTDLSLSEEVEEAWRMRWEIEELQGTSRPWDSSS